MRENPPVRRLLSLVLGIAFAASAATAAAGDWPQFGYDQSRTNASRDATGITSANAHLLVRQQVKLDGIVDSNAIYLDGVTVGGAAHAAFFVTTSYGRTIALDAANGAILWEYVPPGIAGWDHSAQFTTAAPAADPSRRYLYAASPDGKIHKLAVADGSEVTAGGWPVAITLDPAHEKIGPGINVSGNLVLASTGGYIGDFPPYQGHVVSIDRTTGRLVHVAFPQSARVDTGVEPGAEITPWYDPMIAKLVVHGDDRATALGKMVAALGDTHIAGVTTNVEFLRRICESAAFAKADLDTGLIERHRAELFRPRGEVPREVLAAAALAELAHEEETARERAERSADRHSPWHRVDGWRLNEESHHDFVFTASSEEHRVRVAFGAEGRRLSIDSQVHEAGGSKAQTVRDGKSWHVFHQGVRWTLTLKEELGGLELDAGSGSLAAPMPGRVIKVFVQPGAKVKKGEPLLILEAMKMEHTITAPADGTVKEIHYAAGEQVLEGAELIKVE